MARYPDKSAKLLSGDVQSDPRFHLPRDRRKYLVKLCQRSRHKHTTLLALFWNVRVTLFCAGVTCQGRLHHYNHHKKNMATMWLFPQTDCRCSMRNAKGAPGSVRRNSKQRHDVTMRARISSYSCINHVSNRTRWRTNNSTNMC